MITEYLTEDDVNAVRAVSYCCSEDELLPQLCMVQLSDGYAMATDSYRMAVAELPDFDVSAVPKWVSPLALPGQGSCRLDYELVEVKENETSTASRAVDGQPWPFTAKKLDFWSLLVGDVLSARLTIGADARAAIVGQIAAWRKDKTLRRHGAPEEAAVTITRSGHAVQLGTARQSVAITDDEPERWAPEMPLRFNNEFFSQLLRYAPPGAVDLQMQGHRHGPVVHYGTGPAVIQLDDEIHALMPIRTAYEVKW